METNIVNNSKPPQNNMCSKPALENIMSKQVPPYEISKRLETEINFNERDCSKDDTDFDRQTSSGNDSRNWMHMDEMKTEIKNILEDHPEGVWCSDLIRLYRERYGRELDILHYGCTDVLSLACVLGDSLRIWRPEGSADCKMFTTFTDSNAPSVPVTSAFATSVPVTSAFATSAYATSDFATQPSLAPLLAALSLRSSRDTSTTVDPDDALPGIDFDPDVFPADCMQYMESIPCLKLPEESMIEVQVGELYSPSHLWLMRLGNDYNIAMEEVLNEMDEYYLRGEGRERVLFLSAVRVGHYCTSRFEGHWYRSIIVKLMDCDTVKVRHVDYGTVEQCAVESLRPLLRRWGVLPQQAIRARLVGVRPPFMGRCWPRPSAAHLLQQVIGRRFVAQIVSRSADAVLEVVLNTSKHEDICINIELVRSGHADFRPDSCLGSSDCYLYPSFVALESGETPNYAEINAYLRDGIPLDFVEDYRRHVPSLYDYPSPRSMTSQDPPSPCFPRPMTSHDRPARRPSRPMKLHDPPCPRPMTSHDSPAPRPPRPKMSHYPPSSRPKTSHYPPSPRPPRPKTSQNPPSPRTPRPMTSHDPPSNRPLRPVISDDPPSRRPAMSHNPPFPRPLRPIMSHYPPSPFSPRPMMSHDPSSSRSTISHNSPFPRPRWSMMSHDPPSSRPPRSVTSQNPSPPVP